MKTSRRKNGEGLGIRDGRNAEGEGHEENPRGVKPSMAKQGQGMAERKETRRHKKSRATIESQNANYTRLRDHEWVLQLREHHQDIGFLISGVFVWTFIIYYSNL